MANTIITPQIFSKEVIRNLDREVILLGHTNRAYEWEIKKAGDTVRVQTLPTLTFTASTIIWAWDFTNSDVGTWPGGGIIASDFAITVENLIINKYTEKRVTLTSLEIAQSNLSLEEKVASRFAEGMGTLMDNEVRDQILVTQVANIPAGNKLNSGAPVTLTVANIHTEIMAMRTALKKQNVKVSNMRLFVGTDAEALLLQSDYFKGSDFGWELLTNGAIGRIGWVPVYSTTALDASKEMIMMAEGAVNAVVQITETKVTEGTDGFYTNILAQIVWGMKIFGENTKAIAINYVA